ncbi:MAG: SU10 major capsid protein [Thiomonas sp.]
MAFAGLRGTGDWAADERPKDFREYILWANPNGTAPLTALLSKAASQKASDPEFIWWEEKLEAIRVQLTTGYTATDTTFAITGGGLRLVPGDVLMIEKTESASYDNEFVEVSSVTNDTTIVVKRGQAGSTAGTVASGSYLTKVGSAFAEGTRAPLNTGRNPNKLFNYCEIFKTTVESTRTATQTELRTGDSWKNDKKRRAFDHSVDLEMAFLFGRRYETLGDNGKPKRYTGGLRYFLSTNVTIFTTTPTEDTFLNAVYKVFDYNKDSGAGDERIVLCGNGALNSLNKLARTSPSSRITFKEVIKLYGMNLQLWILPQGTLAVRTHPLMNLHGRFTYSMFIIDPTNLKYRYLLDTTFKDNVQLPDEDTRKGMWITEAGLEVNHEYTMGYIGNFVV